MKHSIVLKFIAIALAAIALVAAAGGAAGVALLESAQLYSMDYDTWVREQYERRADLLGTCMTESYAARTFSDLTDEELAVIDWGNSSETISQYCDMEPDAWSYSICNTSGTVLEGDSPSNAYKGYIRYETVMTVRYPVRSNEWDQWEEAHQYWNENINSVSVLYFRYEESDKYVVTVWIAEDAIAEYNGIALELYEQLVQLRYYLIGIIAAGLLVIAICAVYLCCAAGRSAKDGQVCPGGLNRLPLDVYAAGAGLICFLLGWLMIEVVEGAIYYSSGYNVGALALGSVAALVMAVVIIGFLFAVAAQVKLRRGYWWRHTVIGWCLRRLWHGLKWLGRGIRKVFAMLPLIWQYLLIGLAMGLAPMLALFLCMANYGFAGAFWAMCLILSVLADIGILCYGAYAYGTLLKGAQRMAQGNLYAKIPTRYLIGSYKQCAENLNALADVSVVAAKNQLKSERMKTELITNVSHDIKTPLTSIINYVDLLQKPHSQQEEGQYLEVLGRQSQRLKKLIDDLMEMSKATTGNMAVEITRVDAVETVNQALGEFADKLAAAQLTPVFRQPETEAAILADGRLTWRVLSNLLSNIVKYALPGTRVYLDLARVDGQVLVSLKNISREELNVSADELTERFVRGDASRNTEGSGLGLNIAKSLMELQKGQLQLLIDGDLFKVTLIFPAG